MLMVMKHRAVTRQTGQRAMNEYIVLASAWCKPVATCTARAHISTYIHILLYRSVHPIP